MLDVFAVFGDQGGTERGKFLSELGENFVAYQRLDGFFREGLAVDVYLELRSHVMSMH